MKSIIRGVLIVLLAVSFFTTCDTKMGMGDIVDTIPPQIVIVSPYDGEWMDGVNRGDPIKLRGTFYDADTGVESIAISEVFTGKKFNEGDGLVRLTMNESKGTWEASILITESGDYRIRVTAFDRFKNEGSDTVNIRIDVVDPLVQNSKITRYLDDGNAPESDLNDREYYESLNYQNSKSYQKIKWANIDEFQNESFTLRLQFADSFSGVAASRLYVLDGEYDPPRPLHINELVPDRGGASRTPEWDITGSMLTAWNPDYSTGPHFIQFEVWAWNEANWDKEHNQPKEGASHREQIIKGTCWYPESDAPHVAVEAADDVLATGQIYLDTKSTLSISVYDDDKLSEIYAGFIPKEDFDDLRLTESEDNYLESLTINSARRNAIISQFKLKNIFNPDASADGRQQPVKLDTGDTIGEYRLIAIVRDDKKDTSVHYKEPAYRVWGVHPSLKVHIRNPDSPIIIVENPAAENTFPTLTGTKFNLSGYTIDRQGVQWIQIAWYSNYSDPDAFSKSLAALQAEAPALSIGSSTTTADGIKVWKFAVGAETNETLNGVDYKRNNFTAQFDILSDFGTEANSQKLFVIQARNVGSGDTYKSFRMSNYTTPPTLTIVYPYQDMLVHDTKEDLVLHMTASAALGIGIVPNSLKITDVTAGNLNPDLGFETDPDVNTGEKKRLVTSEYIIEHFGEGAKRTYRFEAKDILGNEVRMDRTIIMSNLPTLLYITSSSGPGLYKEGDKLSFEAVFSRAVRVTGNPKLKLFFKDPGDYITPISPNEAVADYEAGFGGGNTIRFSYTVKKGDLSDRLHTGISPFDLNGATITNNEKNASDTYDNATIQFEEGKHEGSLQNAFKDSAGKILSMALDGVYPKINQASFAQAVGSTNGNSYFSNGKTVTLKLRADEPVQVSGTPTATIGYGANRVTAEFSSVKGQILEFTWIVNANVDETQLTWASPWIQFPTAADKITDMAGNPIDLTVLPTGGNLNGNNAGERAYIDTIAPPPPTFSIHTTVNSSAGAIADPVLANESRYIWINNVDNTAWTLYHSFTGGSNPINYTTGTNADKTLTDKDAANKDKDTYVPSEYAVTAWQTDRAGNRSPNATVRSVTINSRAPELEGISCTQPDGSYAAGSVMEFKLNFSRPVRATANHSGTAPITLTLRGTDATFNSTMAINMQNNDNDASKGTSPTNPVYSTIFTFNCTVPTGLKMKTIKAVTINLSGVRDEYGNTFTNKSFNSAISVETTTQRPIPTASDFNRPNIIILSVGPAITSWTPAAPVSGSSAANGNIIAGNQISFTFDTNVTAQAGGMITVKPYGTWALPPILTTEEMDTLYKSASTDEYKRRLKWINDNNLPQAPYAQRDQYNFYVRNTNGLKNTGGKVRSDTDSKWVLAFQHDLYGDTNEQRLRDVFNAAKWKWQEIASTSGSVSVIGATVTVTLKALDPGRIWEVLIDAGSFRDDAGNNCQAVASGAYRFWSAGTANPVIRVDKFSHGDHYEGNFINVVSGKTPQETIPKIDARVRIDCETPGASIRYNVIRTSYTPAIGSAIFSSTSTSPTAFFGHANVPTNRTAANNLADNYAAGYNNNSIGNGKMHLTSTPVVNPPRDADDFFVGLLVPITVQTGTATLGNAANDTDQTVNTHNGAIQWSSLTTMGGGINSGGNLNTSAIEYRTVSNTGTTTKANAVFNGTRTFEQFFYVGDAFTTGTGAATDDTVSSNTDAKLFTGRRDYIAAVAKKNQVSSGSDTGNIGPALDISAAAYEGVFKTTVLFRDFGDVSTRFIVQGTDSPMTPSTPGFPLRASNAETPSGFTGLYNGYFSRQSYRTSGTIPASGTTGDNDNNYIWVSWAIVTDWYLMGRGYNGTTNNFFNRNQFNYNGVLATYGAVTYRYRQYFNGGSTESLTAQDGAVVGPSN